MARLKKIVTIIAIIISGVIFSGQSVQAEEAIQNYKTDIIIGKDASVNIVETIEYNFGNTLKHGMSRNIPIKYLTDDNTWRSIKIKNIKVLMDGRSVKYRKSRQGRNLKIKIGDANKNITGKHSYQISYTVDGAINYFTEHDELYWNVIGSEWEVPIKNANVNMQAPKIIKTRCFQGLYGSLEECVSKGVDTQTASFVFRALEPGEGGTIVIGVEKGLIKEPSRWQRWGWFLMDNWILFWPVIIFFWAFKVWWKLGRDPEGRGTIIPYYDVPDNLSVAESSAIVYNQLRTKDISAMIIQLAVKGCLKIKKEKVGKIFKHDKYNFYRTENKSRIKTFLTAEEQKLLEDLFFYGEDDVVSTDNLKEKFYSKINSLKSVVRENIKSKGFLPKKSENKGLIFVMVGLIQGGVSAGLFFIWGILPVIVAVISFVILVFFAIIMGHRTKKGVIAREKLLGLKLYLETAEKDRLKFHNAPSKNPQQFEKLLPYAMVFEVEKEWAEQFKDIYKESPDWYQGTNGEAFSSVILANSLNSFSKIATSSVASAPSSASSGGSGFSGGGSGGGFGGGGGGSW